MLGDVSLENRAFPENWRERANADAAGETACLRCAGIWQRGRDQNLFHYSDYTSEIQLATFDGTIVVLTAVRAVQVNK